MNILLINHYAGSPKHGMEYRPYYIAREWIGAGHQVTIAAASYTHLRSKNPSISKSVKEESIDGIRYLWFMTPSYEGNGLGRILNMLTFVFRLWVYLLKQTKNEKYDAVVASSTYPLDIYPARMLKKRSGAKFIYEVHDLWPLSPMELGNIPAWHPYIMLMQKAENDAYRYCDAVVSILPCALQHMVKHGLLPERFFYIPNGIVTEEWSSTEGVLPFEHRETIKNLKQNGKLVVGYAGAHGIANSLDTIIHAAEICQKDNIAFVLVGPGPEKDRLINEAERRNLGNVVFLPPVNKLAVPELISLFDICYIGLQRQPLFRFGVSPNKLMDYMMAAKPIICAIEAGNDPVSEARCGISVPAENPQRIVEAAMELSKKSDEERAIMGSLGHEYVLKNHDYKAIARSFLHVLSQADSIS